jgi:archaellum component FlaF (FlaF/FlaG flagellin family)|tara:strand:- start:92 stop:355 length:264 start_codon:yes stop_codon:yes gene_type:complete
MENTKSQRGLTIEGIVNPFLENNAFTEVDICKQKLQEELNNNLNFKADITKVENGNNISLFEILFENENGDSSVLNVTVIPSGRIEQ